MKALFALVVLSALVWSFWMSWEWLRNRSKNKLNK